MRRFSLLLAIAVLLLSGLVGYTYRLRIEKERSEKGRPRPEMALNLEAQAKGWHWQKDDPDTNKPVVRVDASAFVAVQQPYTFRLQEVKLRLYDKGGSTYTYVRTASGIFDQWSGVLKSEAPVTIIMHVPAGKNADVPAEVKQYVQVVTSGVTYESKTGRAFTDKPASFRFAAGDGQAIGVEYDPTKRELHLKSQISLDWVGDGARDKALHVESGDLVYKELEQKIYLTPWSKLKRQDTTIQGLSSTVTLIDGVLHQIETDHAHGTDQHEDRTQSYSGNKMTALFDEDGVLVNIVAQPNARIASDQPGSKTTITSDKADLRFTANTKLKGGKESSDSLLHLVLSDGHAKALSVPTSQPGVDIAETRILRSDHIELEMKPGGQDIQEVRTASRGQLEFLPNSPGQSHRTLDATPLRIIYGPNNAIDTFLAWHAATHTDKPPTGKQASSTGTDVKPSQPTPALTWSDQLVAKFGPGTNKIATIQQDGNFRYQEGVRQATAKRAFIDQKINRIDLVEAARVWDDTGTTKADRIVMNQASGDMDAAGNVITSHEPDKNAKPGTSMLDEKQPMQAKADSMQTREDNVKVHYSGHAVVWQSANRIAADVIDIDRGEQTLHAVGHVWSELIDKKSHPDTTNTQSTQVASQANSQADSKSAPMFAIVRAPELMYRDDQRIALYKGGVKLTRGQMIIDSDQLRAFLTPKTNDNADQSSLDHAYADGNVTVFEKMSDRTRTGTSRHCEYYTKDDKVVMNGGLAQMVDSVKGIVQGRQLTFFNQDDRLIAEGQKGELAFTRMNKK